VQLLCSYFKNGTLGYNHKDGIVDTPKRSLYSIRIDGSERTKLNHDWSSSISVIGDRVFYQNDNENRRPYTIKFDGSDRKPVG